MTDRNYTADACKIAGSFIDDLRDVDVSTMQEVLETDDELDVDALRGQITLVADDLDMVIDRQPDERPGFTLIGPLTADEWCSLRAGADDDPFQCCGDTSDLRDAAFHALRMGGEEWAGTLFHAAWIRVGNSHPDHALATHPVVGKLYDAYVKGRSAPPTDEEMEAFVADQRTQLLRGAVREVLTKCGVAFGGDKPKDLDSLLDDELAEIADKAAGSFRRENEALRTGAATPNVQYVALADLLKMVSALRLVLGFEATPVPTEIVDELRAERNQVAS